MPRGGVRKVMALTLALVVGSGAVAPTPTEAQTWQEYSRYGGCVGGRKCSPRPIEVPLEDRPVLRVRFFAANVVSGDEGRLRVTLDGRTLDRDLVLDRRGRNFELDADGSRGRFLRFEATGADGVDIRSIEVLYGDHRSADSYRNRHQTDRDYDRGHDELHWGADGWASYRRERACIGGKLCDSDTLRIRLLDEPIERLRFFAHDEFGKRYRGQVRVYLDNWVLANRLDIERRGRTHDLEVAGRRGSYLIFEAIADDEVMIEDIEVLYRSPRALELHSTDRSPSRYRYGYDGPGECIGGDLCGQRLRIEILLDGLPIDAVRFHAHSDVGERAEGRLRVLLDRDILEEDLDIPRRGDFYQIDLGDARGRLLTFEAIDRGEVVVEDIEVRYQGKSWTRHRIEEKPR